MSQTEAISAEQLAALLIAQLTQQNPSILAQVSPPASNVAASSSSNDQALNHDLSEASTLLASIRERKAKEMAQSSSSAGVSAVPSTSPRPNAINASTTTAPTPPGFIPRDGGSYKAARLALLRSQQRRKSVC